MPAYVVGQVVVHDSEAYDEYRKRATATVEKFGGRFLARGGRVINLEGEEPATCNVILEFDSLETIEQWFSSPEYQDAKAYRDNVSVGNFMALEGL
ncbi:MAG: hypothetical protein CL569_02825 [Alphaproteobacteria bacterium]|nr:hypothetical protein [Alphaproteobacteria bacterium]|tara:strand:+ start:674 stop:961 length:288 start_codon:yes stop_codon:yes gene_type:complete